MEKHSQGSLLQAAAQMSKRPKNTHAHLRWEKRIGESQDVKQEAISCESPTGVALGEGIPVSLVLPTSPKIQELRARHKAARVIAEELKPPRPRKKSM